VADVVDMDGVDMLIGIDFFLSHRIYVARSQNRILFTYNGGPVFSLSEKQETPAADASAADAPQDAAGFSHRGAVTAARGDLKRALADPDRAVELAPVVAAYRAQRGQLNLALRQRDAALADLDEALRLDPQADEARLDRAYALQANKATDAARADLQVLDGRLSTQSNLRRRMGHLFLAMDEPGPAVQQFDQWVASHAREADLHTVLNSRCWARALTGTQLDKALDDCDEALDARPEEAAYLDSRGLVYLRQGKWKKAIADYNAALAVNPKLAWSLWGRGLAQLHAGARDQGLADIAAAKAMRPRIEAETHLYGIDVPPDLAAAP
jgi:tetratricopeptide (TPR) repeat protein